MSPDGIDKELSVMNDRRYVRGDMVWVKLRGYPWWPANVLIVHNNCCKVKSSENVPTEILDPNAIKQIQMGSLVPVFFFGTHD